jgi:hypothetical protein
MPRKDRTMLSRAGLAEEPGYREKVVVQRRETALEKAGMAVRFGRLLFSVSRSWISFLVVIARCRLTINYAD